ncbi:MAG: hydrogenase formation protein HypD [Inquilinus sp.]|nr:hydrogenase formation protein HypD [Inquilinus sp.]
MIAISEFRRGDLGEGLVARLAHEADPSRHYRLLEICGGHAATVLRYGLQAGLPANIDLIHGPACPVCSLPAQRIDQAIELAERHGAILCTYGDLLQVPAVGGRTLIAARADGADIRQIRSPLEAFAIARAEPARDVVLFAFGFETTAATTAAAVQRARQEGVGNFTVLCAHLLTTAALQVIFENARPGSVTGDTVDGVLGPGHVGGLIGSRPFAFFVEEYQKPVVMAGPEPLDVLQAVLMLVRQINEGRFTLENQFGRVATPGGNSTALGLLATVFEPQRDVVWRGWGAVPYGGLGLAPDFAAFDAEIRHALSPVHADCEPAAKGSGLLRGLKAATAYPAGGGRDRPETPLGSCLGFAEEFCGEHRNFGRDGRNGGLTASETAAWT